MADPLDLTKQITAADLNTMQGNIAVDDEKLDLGDVWADFDKWTDANELLGEYKSGIPALDNALGGGFPRIGLGVLFASTSLGKSTLVDQIAISYCRANKAEGITPAVMIFGTENGTCTSIAKLCNCAYFQDKTRWHWDKSDYKAPDFTIKDFKKRTVKLSQWGQRFLQNFYDEFCHQLFFKESRGYIQIDEIETCYSKNMKKLKRNFNETKARSLVIVDLVNHVHPEDDLSIDKRLELDQAILQLRDFAFKNELFVLCVCSANRMAFRAPLDCSAIKESGGVENFADLVMGLDVIRMNEEGKNTPEKTYYMDIARRYVENYGYRLLQLIFFKNREGDPAAPLCCAYDPKHDYFDFSRPQQQTPQDFVIGFPRKEVLDRAI